MNDENSKPERPWAGSPRPDSESADEAPPPIFTRLAAELGDPLDTDDDSE